MSDTQDVHDVESNDRVESARGFLAGILERMDIDADVEVIEKEDRICLEIRCEDAQRVIGRRGQLMDSLQHLVAKKVARVATTEERGKPIVVDADGYRDRQIERLEALAERMVQKALRHGEPVELSPMTAHDRRVVHLAVAEMAGVSTRSEGEGDLRHVVVVPEPEGDGGARPAE